MDITGIIAAITTFVTTAYQRFVRFCRVVTTPSVEKIMTDFQRKINALNAVIDNANDAAAAAAERRQKLRDQVVDTYAVEAQAQQAASNASRLRTNLENITNG